MEPMVLTGRDKRKTGQPDRPRRSPQQCRRHKLLRTSDLTLLETAELLCYSKRHIYRQISLGNLCAYRKLSGRPPRRKLFITVDSVLAYQERMRAGQMDSIAKRFSLPSGGSLREQVSRMTDAELVELVQRAAGANLG